MRRMAAAHSRTCVTLPGDDSAASVCMVCMESTITMSGRVSLMWANTCSKDVSHKTRQPLSCGPMRSARSLSWRSLSSPDT